ncbi:MAG: SDR family oxidoreductase [Ignavibacteria bacterium]|nr:SDR family oxidoreductase [Ignavibacteria bacterium]
MRTNSDTALITGASSGIGATFARQLAEKGYSLILIARRQDRLASLADELQQAHSVRVETLVSDLANLNDIKTVEKHIGRLEHLSMLVNNAGFGTTGNFAELDVAKQIDMINVHIIASVRLCRAALPGMIARHQGTIINLASTAAFVPIPGHIMYNATKAYLVFFSEALQAELVRTGVNVQALCPGFTYTEFHDTSEFKNFNRFRIPKPLWMSAEDVVSKSLKALKRNHTVYIPGFINRCYVAAMRNRMISPLLFRFVKRKSRELHESRAN